MSRRGGFVLFAVLVFASLIRAADGKSACAQAGPSSSPTAEDAGVHALFSWADVDGDGRLELAAVSGAGTLQLLTSTGDGRFEDVTERFGLAGIENAALAVWADYDGDGRLDLFVGARVGASRLFHNEGGDFVDTSAASGLSCDGSVQSAQWFDHDGDGWLDLFVVAAEKNELFRGLEGGFFERAELPLAAAGALELGGARVADQLSAAQQGTSGPHAWSASGDPGKRVGLSTDAALAGSVSVHVANPSGGSAPLLPPVGTTCLSSITNQANPSACLQASTTPTMGKLYPISTTLFVAVAGNVGIGTTTPAAKLDVAGTARVSGTLTLAPSGDQALNVSTGSIYKGGALFIHTRGGSGNTAFGQQALSSVTTGFSNTASGYRALRSTATGRYNTAIGMESLGSNLNGVHNTACGAMALSSNTSGSSNTANGMFALFYNVQGSGNTACGSDALIGNTFGYENTACGFLALMYNTTGNRNVAVGYRAGYYTTGDQNIAIGNPGVWGESNTLRIGTTGSQSRAFLAGIHGVTTGIADASLVYVDSAGQLGTIPASLRFKKDIAAMGERTERLFELRPVVFRCKQERKLRDGAEPPLEYGLIAEEVAEIFPDLVVYDETGHPLTVKYHLLSSMLLNELQKLRSEVMRLRGLEARLAALEGRLASAVPAGSR